MSPTTSIWMASTAAEPLTAALPTRTSVDVCVVGAGMAGLSTAYHLIRGGARVLVLDQGPIGAGETGRTTAHLASALDDRFHVLEKMHGAEGARLAAESHAAAIDSIERIARTEDIACDFARVDGYLVAARPRDAGQLDDELAAAARAGLAVDKVPQPAWSWLDTGPCLRFRHQAEFHPLRYVRGLAHVITRLGGSIATGVRAVRIDGGKRCRVFTADRREIDAGAVIVATNSPIHGVVAVHAKQAAFRSYVVAFEVPAGAIPHALVWDTDDPYHYLRVARADRSEVEWLVVGGEDHRTGQADDGEDRFTRLESWTRERFAMAGAVARRWSGQILEPADGLAFIGPSPGLNPNLYLTTGDSGNGLTHGALAGLILSDLVLGRANPWSALYDPSRVKPRSLGDLVRENLNTAAQYADWVTPGDGATDAIPAGGGAVVRRGLHKIAVHRDEGGALHAMSATCPHLGGIVAWNSTEKTWDCPCHGSRFDATGRVLCGPSRRDLPRER